MGIRGGVNLYGYVGNNPVRFNDSKGLFGIPILPPNISDANISDWGQWIKDENLFENGYILCFLASSEAVFGEDACMKFNCLYECEDGSTVNVGHVSECAPVYFLPYTPID